MALLTGGVCDGGMEGWEVTQGFLPFSLFVPRTSRPTVRQLLHQRRFVCRRHVDPTESFQSTREDGTLLQSASSQLPAVLYISGFDSVCLLFDLQLSFRQTHCRALTRPAALQRSLAFNTPARRARLQLSMGQSAVFAPISHPTSATDEGRLLGEWEVVGGVGLKENRKGVQSVCP
ncbi:hypothetical protein C0Q70_13738 [Pomacea canaliculata]|uniref:Uncharacterized protein n=1 Tax=Pomacea canaliculata TaxID=400727 RepID=A0A2T7NY16_POMCA|nr:hypothetical protein C0Q70_13738 [Pomacea canaliculata]